jgi:hypothetical protein
MPRIIELAYSMNPSGKRKYSKDFLLQVLGGEKVAWTCPCPAHIGGALLPKRVWGNPEGSPSLVREMEPRND